MEEALSQGPGPQEHPVDEAKLKRVNNAIRFLSSANVKKSPLSRRVNFLKSKGLSAEEITEAFDKAGQPQSLESINSIISGAGAPLPAAPAAPAAPAMYAQVPQQQQQQQQQQPQPMQPMQPGMYAPPQMPRAQCPPPTVPAPESRWKDYALACGAALIGGFALWKAAEVYSPFEFRRKSSSNGSSRTGKKKSSKKNRRLLTDDESLSECSIQLRQECHSPTRRNGASTAEFMTKNSELTKENAELSTKVTELTEQLEQSKEDAIKDKKKLSEISISMGKTKGQLTRVQRDYERVSQQLDFAQEELTALKDKKQPDETVPTEEGTAPTVPAVAAVQETALPMVQSDTPSATPIPKTPEPLLSPNELS